MVGRDECTRFPERRWDGGSCKQTNKAELAESEEEEENGRGWGNYFVPLHPKGDYTISAKHLSEYPARELIWTDAVPSSGLRINILSDKTNPVC